MPSLRRLNPRLRSTVIFPSTLIPTTSWPKLSPMMAMMQRAKPRQTIHRKLHQKRSIAYWVPSKAWLRAQSVAFLNPSAILSDDVKQVFTIAGADRVKAEAGAVRAKQRQGALGGKAHRLKDGPVVYAARHKGKKGALVLSTIATSPCISFERSSDLENHAPDPKMTFALADITEIKKRGGLGWKSKLCESRCAIDLIPTDCSVYCSRWHGFGYGSYRRYHFGRFKWGDVHFHCYASTGRVFQQTHRPRFGQVGEPVIED